MPEAHGLQIDLQCVKCGRPPTADVPLFEMQNHLHICNQCRIEEEKRGKHIAWVDGLQLDTSTHAIQEASTPPKFSGESSQEKSAGTGIFAALEVSTEASSEEVVEGIKKKMRYWMRQPASSEKDQTIDQLREWQQEINNDTQFLVKQRAKQPRAQSRGSALHIGSDEVYTIQEFVNACEQSSEGWRAGETYLRSGELEYWIYSQIGNPAWTEQVHKTAQSRQTDFQALNYVLYFLSPERPFRLYRQNAWEDVKAVHTATTQEELARLSDLYWVEAQTHLYNGAMIFWLEYSRHIQDLALWCRASIQEYWRDHQHRGLGLELLLEQVVPTLKRPEIVVTFENSRDRYVLEDWDNEIPHQLIHLNINNETRGATILNLELVRPESSIDPDWLYLDGTKQKQKVPAPPPSQTDKALGEAEPTDKMIPLRIYTRPGERNSVIKALFLQNLADLEYGETYTYTLRMSILREYQQPPVMRDFPITIHTMLFRDGFRRQLWKWGLRGHLPGLGWNFLMGAALALLVLLLADRIPYSISNQSNQFQLFLFEVKETLVAYLSIKFVLMSAAITGFIGLCVGGGKGHANYSAASNANDFRRWGFWCAFIPFGILLYLERSYLDRGTLPLLSIGIDLTIGIIVYFIIIILSFVRSLIEQSLRKQNIELLKPQGSR
jgi:hypothetical protein